MLSPTETVFELTVVVVPFTVRLPVTVIFPLNVLAPPIVSLRLNVIDSLPTVVTSVIAIASSSPINVTASSSPEPVSYTHLTLPTKVSV